MTLRNELIVGKCSGVCQGCASRDDNGITLFTMAVAKIEFGQKVSAGIPSTWALYLCKTCATRVALGLLDEADQHG